MTDDRRAFCRVSELALGLAIPPLLLIAPMK
jgi:hypothetical protein